MTIVRGEIDSTDRCRASAVPLIVYRRIPFFIIPDYDASLPQHPSSMPLRRLLPLLTCPLCAAASNDKKPFSLLRNPFTLHCGHTVCSSHLPTRDPTQPCPLPVCSSTANTNTPRPNIPSFSRVVYLSAAPHPQPSRPTAQTSTDQFDQRVDITVSRLIDVVSRHSPPPLPASNLEDSDHSDGDDEHVQLERPQTGRILSFSTEATVLHAASDMRRSSGHRRRPAPGLASQSTSPNHPESTLPSASTTGAISADSTEYALRSSPGHAGSSSSLPPRTDDGYISDGSDLSPEPPKKRLRRDSGALVTDRQTQSWTIEPEAETGNSDYLNRPRPVAEPRQDPDENVQDMRAKVDKELLTQLSCEICFAIYYQPVTTPCQHVSRLFVFFSNFRRFVIPFHPSPPDIHSESLRHSIDHPVRSQCRCFHSRFCILGSYSV